MVEVGVVVVVEVVVVVGVEVEVGVGVEVEVVVVVGIEVVVMLPILIDTGPSRRGWSYYASFARCPMLFYWRYVSPKRSTFADMTAPLARGSLFHVAAAHHYARMRGEQLNRDTSRIMEPMDAIMAASERMGPIAISMRQTVIAMWEAYSRKWPFESFRVLAVEQPREVRFGNALLTARVDLEIEENDGRVWIMDHKTTARLEAKTTRKYRLHGQFFGLAEIGRATYGDRFAGVIVNAIGEDGACRREVHKPAPFMARKFPSVIESLDRSIKSAISTCGADLEVWGALAHPDEQICFGPYGACPALEWCAWGGASI